MPPKPLEFSRTASRLPGSTASPPAPAAPKVLAKAPEREALEAPVAVVVMGELQAMLIPEEQDDLLKVTDGSHEYIIECARVAWVEIG